VCRPAAGAKFGCKNPDLSHPFLKFALALYIAWGGWHWLATRPVHPPDGILAQDDPVQVDVDRGAQVKLGRWLLTERATYRVTARVLGSETYHFDALADLVPEDLALGWGPMSDNRVLRDIDITQSNRFYFWHSASLPVSRDVIIAHSANTHVIPSSRAVATLLARIRKGQVVTLTGVLVDGRRNDGMWIKTSLTRTDSGAGACEVLLVSDVATD
jgi:hypothetical protein